MRSNPLSKKLLTVGGWLFGAAPNSMRKFVTADIDSPQSINFAGRVFSEPDEVELFFDALETRAWKNENALRWITIQWLWAAKRILSGHEYAAQALHHEKVVQLYYFLLDDLFVWIEKEQVNGFVATLWLLLYLLRLRIQVPKFLAVDSEDDRELGTYFDQAIERAEQEIQSRGSFLTGGRKQVAIEILQGIREFREFHGSMNIVTKLVGLDDER